MDGIKENEVCAPIDAFDLEELRNQVHYAIEMFWCVNELLEHGRERRESYSGALIGTILFLERLVQEMDSMIDKALEDIRNGQRRSKARSL